MRILLSIALAVLTAGPLLSAGADIPPQQRLQATTLREISQPPLYYWNSTPVGGNAQLLTLFCRACNVFQGAERDVPLVAVLRDTLGDEGDENDRVTYIWLLSYAHPRLGQRILSAIPFFYWRVGQGSGSVGPHDTKPLMDLSAPQHPMVAQVGRDLLQWSTFDPMMMPVRAATRAYRSNSQDDERLHLEEAISYLRQAPVSNDGTALTQAQLDTVIARLKLRKTLLGGLVSDGQARRVGMQSGFDQEVIRSRNWELLRQWAEKTGLIFEPLNLAGNDGQYAILWFPRKESPEPVGNSLRSIWKLLNIRNPWNDERLENWKGPVFERTFDDNGSPVKIKVIPLAVYSLNYPKLPLMLMDFRDKLSGRRHEMTQRTINELTAGVIGISHFTNWYFYVAADLYNFVAGRHGKAVDQASRLDCYSQFRMELALDRSIDPDLKKDMENRIRSLALNPLEAAPDREIHDAIARYDLLQAEAGQNGRLMTRVDQERRFELSSFGESEKARVAKSMLHVATLGIYKQQAKHDNISMVDYDRRVAHQLSFLDSLIQAGTPPEIAFDTQRIRASVNDLSSLMPAISSRRVREHAESTLSRLQQFSKDPVLQADCSNALLALKQTGAATSPGVVALPRGVVETVSSPNPDRVK